MSVEERAQCIQRDLERNAKDLNARDPRNTVHTEMKSYGIGGAVYCNGRWPFWRVLQGLCQAARLHCPSESLRVQRAFQLIGQQGNVNVQATR